MDEILDKNLIPPTNEMIKIGIYLPGIGLENIDLSRPEDGNPGIGGTEYCELLLSYHLSKIPRHYDVSVISHRDLQLPSEIKNIIISEFDTLKDLDGDLDIIILKTPRTLPEFDILNRFESTKIITWSHNYLNSNITNWISNSKAIVLNVFVSKQMYDFYIDDNVINKSTSIFNIVHDTLGDCIRDPETNTLTFIGSFTLQKGILQLFKIWEIIEKEVPTAKLNVIGGSNLYNRDIKIGQLGIADEYTENKIREYITDSEGNIKKSIRFHGILGKEKYKVFLKSTVGIVNPSAKTETFGLGIIEMATAKLPVVTLNWNGHPDTALDNKTALLGHSIKDMAKNIIRLFNNNSLNISLGEEAKKQVQRFAPEKILPEWEQAISMVMSDNLELSRKSISKPIWNNYKFIRSINSFLRFNLKLKFLPSIVELETLTYNLIKRLR